MQGAQGLEKVIPDGRACLLCTRCDSEVDHVFKDQCMAWGYKPVATLYNKGNCCFYCLRTFEGKFEENGVHHQELAESTRD